MPRLLVDTNLLVLWSVGSALLDFIAAHKRTRTYSIDDFSLLQRLLAQAESLVTTPNVLTETSNLIRQFAMPGRGTVVAAFGKIVSVMHETVVPSRDALLRPEFIRLGLADCATIAAQDAWTILLTDDLELYLASLASGRQALNFEHERHA